MTHPIDTGTRWLVDVTALTADEREGLRRARTVTHLYDHLPDPSALTVGPMLLAPCDVASAVAHALQADDARSWAVAQLDGPPDDARWSAHFRSICHVHTHDGQRYFVRYADSRSLTSLWPVLTPAQQRRMLGPLRHWSYTDRRGHPQHLAVLNPSAQAAQAAQAALGPVRLSAGQLGELLSRTWPDQLLGAVLDHEPRLAEGLRAWQRHHCAQQVCDWLDARGEERYPVQLALLRSHLSADACAMDAAAWAASLHAAHAEATTPFNAPHR
jgi:Domain of unknown function (DUF4123)